MISDLIKSLLPMKGQLTTEFKVDVQKGWLIIAIKLPTEAKA